MLSTKQLQDYIVKELKKEPNMTIRDLHFYAGQADGIEGIFVFSQDGKYILRTIEKGAIIDQYETTDERDLLWNIVENTSINSVLQYAKDHTVSGMDFRRAMFERRLEIFSTFGADFKQKAEREIAKILDTNPYNDNLGTGGTGDSPLSHDKNNN